MPRPSAFGSFAAKKSEEEVQKGPEAPDSPSEATPDPAGAPSGVPEGVPVFSMCCKILLKN